MNGESFEDDDLAFELAEALRATAPFSAGVAARAKGAFTWRTVDEDLLTATLMSDTAQQPELATRGGPQNSRVLVFTAQLRTVEVEVLSDRVVGQFLPQSGGEVQVEADAGVLTTVPVDDLGFFVIEPVPTGVVRLRCTTPTTRLVTDWVRL